MKLINKYTFLEYSKLNHLEIIEYDYYIEFSKEFQLSCDIFNVGDLTNKEFGIIKDIQYDLKNELTYGKMFEHIFMLTGKKYEDAINIPLVEIIQFKNYYLGEIKRICEIETNLLEYIPTEEEKQAGIEIFNCLGVHNQIRNLAGNDPTKFNKIRELKYNICLLELYARKLTNDYQNEYRKIIDRKIKIR